MDTRYSERIARNEVAFRALNEQLDAKLIVLNPDDDGSIKYSFVCECAVSECMDMVELTLQEYSRIRSNPAWFGVRPGHRVVDFEATIDEHERYWIVEKLGPGRILAEAAAEA